MIPPAIEYSATRQANAIAPPRKGNAKRQLSHHIAVADEDSGVGGPGGSGNRSEKRSAEVFDWELRRFVKREGRERSSLES